MKEIYIISAERKDDKELVSGTSKSFLVQAFSNYELAKEMKDIYTKKYTKYFFYMTNMFVYNSCRQDFELNVCK